MKITTLQQFEVLIAEMEKNPCLAKGFTKGHVPANFKDDWDAISMKLNASGPPVRNSDGWQRVWKDLKFKVKKKCIHNKREASSTGGGIFKQMPLSSLEEAVANLVQFEKLLNPQGAAYGTQETIVTNTSTSVSETQNIFERPIEIYVETVEEGNEQAGSYAEAPTSSKKTLSSKRFKKEEVLELLKNQNKLQQDHNESSRRIFNEMNKSLKDCARYQRKRFEIEQEKLSILKTKAKLDEEDRASDREIKKIKLQLLNKELNSL